MTRDDIASSVRINLDDAGVISYSAADVNDAIQDGYDDVAVLSGCINKTATVSLQDSLSYYDFAALGVSDFYSVVAIRNNNNNRFLTDFQSRIEFDRIRPDWETWAGQPEMFCPINSQHVAICPKLADATGNFTLFYKALAPTLSGGTTPLIHHDVQHLLEWYATADLLEQFEEFTKARTWWRQYETELKKYSQRIQNLAHTDIYRVLAVR